MSYLSEKYSHEKLKQRAFILSAFTRMKMQISVSVYEFADRAIEQGWLPYLASLEEVDEEILDKYNSFIQGNGI